jgi:hypothetical protein
LVAAFLSTSSQSRQIPHYLPCVQYMFSLVLLQIFEFLNLP